MGTGNGESVIDVRDWPQQADSDGFTAGESLHLLLDDADPVTADETHRYAGPAFCGGRPISTMIVVQADPDVFSIFQRGMDIGI